MKYVVDLNLMREYENISEYIRSIFGEILAHCEPNLDSIYDILSENLQGGEIILKNLHLLEKFGNKAQAMKSMLETLADEFSQWKFSTEPDIKGELKGVYVRVLNKCASELILNVNDKILVFGADENGLKVIQLSKNSIANSQIFELKIANDLLGLNIVSKCDVRGIFGTDGIEINFERSQKSIFINLANTSLIEKFDECLKVSLANG